MEVVPGTQVNVAHFAPLCVRRLQYPTTERPRAIPGDEQLHVADEDIPPDRGHAIIRLRPLDCLRHPRLYQHPRLYDRSRLDVYGPYTPAMICQFVPSLTRNAHEPAGGVRIAVPGAPPA